MASIQILRTLAAAVLLSMVVSTPLDDYVKKPDSHYKYTPLKVIKEENFTIHILNMTSQKWMTDKFSDRSIWWHYVCVVIPKKIKVKDTAFLLIDGGHSTDEVPGPRDLFLDIVTLIAVSTQTIGVTVKEVPNQPIVFPSDPSHRRRQEDSLMSWAWHQYLHSTSQPYSLPHIPMTKAVVRAMDTVDDYSKKIRRQRVNKFFLTGVSKRGWVTFLTAAVDSRVIGIAPLVFDLLNMKKALHHHYRSLGGWSFAFENYYGDNITSQLDSPNFEKMCKIIDPLVYKDRYKMPIYIVKATGDEFFLPDETSFYFDQLTAGPRFLRVVQNCEHTLVGQISNVFLSLRSFYLHLIHGATYPKISWTMTSNNKWGSIRVIVDRQPLNVTTHHAQTLLDGRRDFRFFQAGPKGKGEIPHSVFWYEGPAVTKLSPREYEAKLEVPVQGWTAFFVEVTFQGVNGSILSFTTEVMVVPDTLPFPGCNGLNCTGKLV